MSPPPASTPIGPPLVRFGRRSTRGVILGFSLARVVALVGAATVFTIGLLSDHGVGALVAVPLWAGLVAAAFVRWGGQPVAEWVPVATHYAVRRVTKQTVYHKRVFSHRPAGTLALPGRAAQLRVYQDPDTGAAMIHHPTRQRLSAVLQVTAPAYVLLSPDSQRDRVAAWGRLLGAMAGQHVTLQVLEATVADPGVGVADWYREQGTHDDSWADQQYRALLEAVNVEATTHRTTITVTLDMRGAARQSASSGRGVRGGAAVLGQVMAGLEHALQAAELTIVQWQSAPQLAAMIRCAYDPATTVIPDSPGADLATAGPVAISEHWDHFRHDSGWSAVLWISNWPRIDVPAHFLHSLIFTPGARKTLSIFARPMQADEALRQLQRQKTDIVSDMAQKAKIGQIEELSDRQEWADVLDREQALVAGHADVEFTGLVAVSAADREQLDLAVARVKQTAGQSSCDVRVFYGRQAEGFLAAALPIGWEVL